MDILNQALDVLSHVEVLPARSAHYSINRLESARKLRAIARVMELDAHNSVDYDSIGDPRKDMNGKWFGYV